MNSLDSGAIIENSEQLQKKSWKANVEVATVEPLQGQVQYSKDTGKTNGIFVGDGPLVIDGVVVNVGYRILVKDQTDAKQNGIYDVEFHGQIGQVVRYKLRRSMDLAESPVLSGAIVAVKFGNVNGYGIFMLRGMTYNSADDQILVLNKDAFRWIRINPKSNVKLVGTKDRLVVEYEQNEGGEDVYTLNVDPYLTRDIAKVVQIIENIDIITNPGTEDPDGIIQQLELQPDIIVSTQQNDQKSAQMDTSLHIVNTTAGNLRTNTIAPLPPQKIGQTHIFANINTSGTWDNVLSVDFGMGGVMSASGVTARYINMRPGGSVLVFWNGFHWQMLNNSCTLSN